MTRRPVFTKCYSWLKIITTSDTLWLINFIITKEWVREHKKAEIVINLVMSGQIIFFIFTQLFWESLSEWVSEVGLY
jgi:hypothetical protein